MSSGSSKNIIITILAVLFLASLAGNIFQYFHVNEVIVERDREIFRTDSITMRKQQLDIEFNNAVEQLEQYKGKSQTLDSLLAEANGQLEEQRRRIASLIDKNEGYQVLQQRYDEMRKTTEFYMQEIERLTAENKELKYQNTELSVSLDQTTAQNKELKGKVDMAAKLKIGSTVIRPLTVSASGKEKETDKAKKTDRLSITFTIADNAIAEQGDHTVYLRVLNPEGYVLADASQSVKKFKAENGNETTYSRSISVNYDGNKLTKTVTWDQDAFNPGTYKVEIYIDGYFAGTEKLSLF